MACPTVPIRLVCRDGVAPSRREPLKQLERHGLLRIETGESPHVFMHTLTQDVLLEWLVLKNKRRSLPQQKRIARRVLAALFDTLNTLTAETETLITYAPMETRLLQQDAAMCAHQAVRQPWISQLSNSSPHTADLEGFRFRHFAVLKLLGMYHNGPYENFNADPNLADLFFRQALELYAKVPTNQDKVDVLVHRGTALCYLGRQNEAKHLYEEAIAITVQFLGDSHIEVASIRGLLANVLLELEDFQNARELYEQVIKKFHSKYGNDHPQLAVHYGNLGKALIHLKEYGQAIKLHERSREILKMHGGDEDAVALKNHAEALLMYGDYPQAKRCCEKALEVQSRLSGRRSFQNAPTISTLATVHEMLGDKKEAKNLYEEALEILETHYGPHNMEVGKGLVNLAFLQTSMGEHQQAKIKLQRAVKIFQKHKSIHETVRTLFCLCEVLECLGEHPEAQKAWRRGLLAFLAMNVHKLQY